MKFGGIKVKKVQVACVLGGIILYVLMETLGSPNRAPEGGRALPRNAHGQGETDYELLIKGLEEGEIPVPVQVGEQKYTEKEAETVFQEVSASMEERIKKDNESLQKVYGDLNLMTQLDEYGIRIRWEPEDVNLIDSSGAVSNQELAINGEETWLKAVLTDGEHEAEYEYRIHIYPSKQSKKEEAVHGFLSLVTRLDLEQQTADRLILPEEYEGKKLFYRTQSSSDNKILLVLGVLLAVLLYAKDEMDVRNAQKLREQKLLLDYSEIVSKLMIFISAGMTVRIACERIVSDYEATRKKGKRPLRPAYEEMSRTIIQLKSGTPESQAYGNFGRRCGLQQYLKLSSLLDQNRKTGTKNLKGILEVEMVAAFEQRKNLARRLGEEAGTKLLLPLFLMLGIVMVMIAVPAFLSFG